MPHTITLASLVKGEVLSPKKFGRLPEGLPHLPYPFRFSDTSVNNLSFRTQPSQNRTIPRKPPTPLPPLSKGGGLTARHKPLYCCFLLVPRPPFLFTKPFCRQDGGIASPPSLRTTFLPPLVKGEVLSPKKFGRLPEGLSHHPLPLHQPFQNRTIPRKSPTPLPPLSKGGGLTERHKPLYCCFLLVPRPPFLFTKPFCRQDGGIATSPRPTPTLPKTAPSLRLALYPCLPSKKGRWLDGIAKPLFYIIFIL